MNRSYFDSGEELIDATNKNLTVFWTQSTSIPGMMGSDGAGYLIALPNMNDNKLIFSICRLV